MSTTPPNTGNATTGQAESEKTTPPKTNDEVSDINRTPTVAQSKEIGPRNYLLSCHRSVNKPGCSVTRIQFESPSEGMNPPESEKRSCLVVLYHGAFPAPQEIAVVIEISRDQDGAPEERNRLET
jgi:hypothetical protein